MIENQRQYVITKEEIVKFEKALADMDSGAYNALGQDVRMIEIQRSALEGQLNTLRDEINEYVSNQQ